MTKDKRDILNSIVTNSSSPWMDGSGSLSDVVISSRVRLARNLSDMPFPHLLEEKAAMSVLNLALGATDELNKKGSWSNLVGFDLSEVPLLDRMVLVEKHLISPQHAEAGRGKGLVTGLDERISIMINEEDHLRLQCLYSGLELEEAFIAADGIDDLLEQRLDFAYHERTGFLTACPTNAGTGLRASVMVHLPALAIGDEVSRVLSAVNKLGLVVRGLYGEGTEGQGNVFQISNQITLGQTEKEIIENLSLVVKQVVTEEKRFRETLYKSRRSEVEDRVFRSLGILSNARNMSSGEAVRLWSDFRLGAELEMVPGLKLSHVNEIMVISQPNFVQRAFGKSMSPAERDSKRAELIRKHLADSKA